MEISGIIQIGSILMQAVIFDMDGTLLDSEKLWSDLFLEMLKAFSIPYDKNNMPWKSTSFRKTIRNYLSSPDCRLQKSFEECEAWGLEYMYNYVYPSGIPQLKPNALDTLKTLQTHGVPMCLLTMTRRDALDTVLEYTGMKPFFVFTETTSGQELTKENPEMFIRTAKRLGVSPAECIVVEDSLYAIKAAKEAGCKVWAIEDAKHVNDKETIVFTADRYFNDHMEMSKAFRHLFT